LFGWVLLAMPLLFASCDDLFDIHPYDLKLKGDHDINAPISAGFRLFATARTPFVLLASATRTAGTPISKTRWTISTAATA
jgi:hypothetical protein